MKKIKNTWGRNIVIVYSLFASATLGFVAFAMTQRVDLVSEHYYEDALNHDRTYAARSRAKNMGAHLVVEPAELRLQLSDGAIFDSDVVIDLKRPDDPGIDRHVELKSGEPNAMTVPISKLRAGVWRVEARWHSGAEELRIDTVIRVAQ